MYNSKNKVTILTLISVFRFILRILTQNSKNNVALIHYHINRNLVTSHLLVSLSF